LRPAPRASRAAAAVAVACLASACAGFQHLPWFHSQRWPEPMGAAQEPLPEGDATRYPPGPEEVRVLRHADPVQVRNAGSAGSVPLSFHRKEVRAVAGSGIACAGGGRAEILWPNGSSVILFGRSEGIVGSPSRGEPSFLFRAIEQVRFVPRTEDLYELVGGATLRARDGPVRVVRVRGDVLRVVNESKRSAQVAFRDATIVLDPGQAVDLPLLSFGSQPEAPLPKAAPAQAAGFQAVLGEGTEVSPEGGGLVARGTGGVRALGVRVTLDGGAEARFSGLVPPPRPPAAGGSTP
jgi:hypothetical protein